MPSGRLFLFIFYCSLAIQLGSVMLAMQLKLELKWEGCVFKSVLDCKTSVISDLRILSASSFSSLLLLQWF